MCKDCCVYTTDKYTVSYPGGRWSRESCLRTGTAKSDHLCQEERERERERERETGDSSGQRCDTIDATDDLSGHQQAGAGRHMNDSSVMKPHFSLLCPSQTVFSNIFFKFVFSKLWRFFPSFSVAI